ncbi:unnamed protein product [Auanema sp. JU1783]|nr:unnamed protein product [Auanema sp. JU1783]
MFNERNLFCTKEEGLVDYLLKLNPAEFYCTHAGRIVQDAITFVENNKEHDVFFNIHNRLLGGKGGFGSLLRSFRVNKSTNQLMCRDLNGRRLASIDEERKLRKWVEKAAQREKDKQEKRKIKYERLKNGPAKHDFNDPEYIRKREDILESTEDAFEQGFAQFKKKKVVEEKAEESSEDSDIDFDDFIQLRKNQKRKMASDDSGSKKKKARKDDDDDDSSDDDEDENENGAEILEGLQKYFQAKGASTSKDAKSVSIKNEPEALKPAANEAKKNLKNQAKEEKEFEPVVLENYKSCEELNELGLDWLRHALIARGLKCGGTLEERAKRLFSVKDLKPEKYPKSILAGKKRQMVKQVAKSKVAGNAAAGVKEQPAKKAVPEAIPAKKTDLKKNKSPNMKKRIGRGRASPGKKNVKDDKDDLKDEVKHLTEFTKEDADRVQIIKDQSCSALAAMRKYLAQAGGKSLFPDIDHALQLMFVYKKPAMCTAQSRHRIVLPKSHKSLANTSVCLIMPDLDKSDKAKVHHDVDKQSREWAEKIEEEHGVTKAQIAKILTKTELQRTAHTFKDLRNLASSYDLFLADARVGKTVCTILGKEFRKVHKKPYYIDYGKPLSTTIQTLIQSVNYPLEKFMTRASVPIGHLGQESDDILANVAAVLDEGLKVAPGGLRNIRGIYLQTATSKPSLPIYADDGSSNDITLKVEKPEQRRENQKIVDECSTLPDGLKLEIRKSGKLRVIREADNKAVLFPTVHDEWDENDMPNTKPNIDPAKLKKKRLLKKKQFEKRKLEAAQLKGTKKQKKE